MWGREGGYGPVGVYLSYPADIDQWQLLKRGGAGIWGNKVFELASYLCAL